MEGTKSYIMRVVTMRTCLVCIIVHFDTHFSILRHTLTFCCTWIEAGVCHHQRLSWLWAFSSLAVKRVVLLKADVQKEERGNVHSTLSWKKNLNSWSFEINLTQFPLQSKKTIFVRLKARTHQKLPVSRFWASVGLVFAVCSAQSSWGPVGGLSRAPCLRTTVLEQNKCIWAKFDWLKYRELAYWPKKKNALQ